jgi:hypothetical protein
VECCCRLTFGQGTILVGPISVHFCGLVASFQPLPSGESRRRQNLNKALESAPLCRSSRFTNLYHVTQAVSCSATLLAYLFMTTHESPPQALDISSHISLFLSYILVSTSHKTLLFYKISAILTYFASPRFNNYHHGFRGRFKPWDGGRVLYVLHHVYDYSDHGN